MGNEKKRVAPLGVAGRSAHYLLFFGYFAGRAKGPDITWRDIAVECVEHFGLQDHYEPENVERHVRRMTAEYLRSGI